jgi:hypothetical protein
MCSPNRSVESVMEPHGIYRERNGWGSQHSVRVKYDEHQELDMATDRYRARRARTVLRNRHVDEWQRTTALSPPSHQAVYQWAHDRWGRSQLTNAPKTWHDGQILNLWPFVCLCHRVATSPAIGTVPETSPHYGLRSHANTTLPISTGLR